MTVTICFLLEAATKAMAVSSPVATSLSDGLTVAAVIAISSEPTTTGPGGWHFLRPLQCKDLRVLCEFPA